MAGRGVDEINEAHVYPRPWRPAKEGPCQLSDVRLITAAARAHLLQRQMMLFFFTFTCSDNS